ncbi:MAG: outer rane receptor for ferrienterochelin and colicin [Candidatus Eremiobacteraeota bacterium]|nr:outer rane receptor for ferrienterochelin and colicin [Candidatus Eremiobacteraeota bacterium]
MHSLSRVLSVVGLVALAGGPLSMAPAAAAPVQVAQAAPAQAATDASSLGGVATDAAGTPLAGVVITLRGATTQTTTTDAQGVYRFPTVAPGIYSISARKTGYQSATETDVAVVSGQPVTYGVRLEQVTLTSIREIGRTSTSYRRSTFNASPASVAVVSQQAFVDQGQAQVQRVLDQTPGIVIDHPGTNANNAAPGAITFPSIRGGLGFETASLIDGHPLAIGNFGDYVTTFLNSYVLGGVELIKGPGAAAPEINYAIGGTVNFRTLDPAAKPSGSIVLGMDSFGGQFSNFLLTGSTRNGRLGYVFDYAVNGSPGPLHDADNLTTLGSGTLVRCTPTAFAAGTCKTTIGTTTGAVSNAATNGFQNNPNYGTSSLFACCLRINQNFNGKTELLKLRYNLSPATTVTASYLGSQTWTDQNGNHVYQYAPSFVPGSSAYAGNLTPGQQVMTAQSVFYPDTEWEINNEPIFQAEIRSSIGKDTVLLRGYGASINRLQYNTLTSPTDPYFTTLTLNGTTQTCPATYSYSVALATCTASGKPSVAPTVTAYNNTPVPVTINGGYFRQAEEDKIRGFTGEFDHFINNGKGDVISLALDQTYSSTAAYDYVGSPNVQSVPAGSRQRFQTLLLRGIFNPTPKLNVTLSNYFDQYFQRYSDNGGTTFKEATTNRYDGRLGLAYRVSRDFSLRGSMGSAIAPPYLNLLDRVTTSPVLGTGGTFATNTIASGTLVPETSFGFDIGADARLPGDGQTTVAFDAYRTTLQNQFLSSQYANGNATVCPTGYRLTGTGATPCVPSSGTGPSVAAVTVPLYSTQVQNLGHSRYEGLELAIRRSPAVGFGYSLQGALVRAFPYDINPCFYSTTVKNGVLDCTARTNNLAIIDGVNFLNSGTSGSPGTFNAVSNHAIPYSQGYAEASYNWANGARLSFGEQYYGPNNSMNVPAFVSSNANLRLPIGNRNTLLSINADNLFNVYGNAYISAFQGVSVPLANGKLGLTNANVLTPRVFRFSLTRNFR